MNVLMCYFQLYLSGLLFVLQPVSRAGTVVITKHEIRHGRAIPAGSFDVGQKTGAAEESQKKHRHEADAASAAPARDALLIHCGRQEVSLQNLTQHFTATHLPMWIGETPQLRSGSKGVDQQSNIYI